MHMTRAALVIVSLALGACRANEKVPASEDSSGTRGSLSAAVAQSSATDSAIAPDGSVLLALDGEGLRIVFAASGSTRLLEFGMDSAAAIRTVSVALGPPTTSGTSADCGAGPIDVATFADGLSINIQQGRFVGWSARGSSSAQSLTTMSGIGVGSTRAALDSVYAATVTTTSLGEEFEAGGIAGVLDGTAASARITNLWAGVNCIAR